MGLLELPARPSGQVVGRLALGLGLGAQEGSYEDPAKQDTALKAGCSGIITALAALAAARNRITRNVTPQLALEAMLFEIREALCPR